ncbi:MAG: TRAP transporter large permease subunit, partial [SAR324 cluster bacterium]|nr:TRAP transporter large permease subunit [SAR324 cluster bacterium]
MKYDNTIKRLERATHLLERVTTPISTYMVFIGAGLTMAMALFVIFDIMMRAVFNNPLASTIELATFMLVIVCFCSLSYTMIKEGHVSVDFLIDSFTDPFRVGLKSLFYLLGIVFFWTISWQYVVRMLEAIDFEESSSVMSWPLWPLFLVTTVGCGMIGMVLVTKLIANQVNLIKTISKPWKWTFLIGILGAGIVTTPWILRTLSIDIGSVSVGVIMLLFMMVLLFLGFPVAFSMGTVGILGTLYLVGFDIGMSVIRMSVYESVANYFFSVVPFFVLMGFFCLKAGISQKLYSTGDKWFGHMPGGLSIATIVGCAGFSAICGDSMATAATMGSVSLPEMKKYNYDDSLATGAVAAGGTLGILIPPSLGFIVYAIVTGESVGKLFMAGIVPGVILTVSFAITLY